MQSKTGDSPQRGGELGLKLQNAKTEVPCTLCKATQSNDEDEVGGEIGDRDYDFVNNRRKRGEIEHDRSRLIQLGFGTPSAVALSKKLGIVEPHPTMCDQPRALWDLTSAHSPMIICGPELLHLDFLVRKSAPFFVLCVFSAAQDITPSHRHDTGLWDFMCSTIWFMESRESLLPQFLAMSCLRVEKKSLCITSTHAVKSGITTTYDARD